MAIRRRKALLGSGALTPYVDLWFSAGSFRVGTNQVGALTELAGWSFTGASLRMGFGPTGYLTYGPNNLCLRSQEFDNASWLKQSAGVASAPVITADQALAPDGTMTADLAVFTLNGGTASGDISTLQQTVSSVGPTVQSLYARTSDGTSKVFSFVGPGGTVAQVTITASWARIYVADPLTGTGAMRLRLRGSASGEGTATSASIYLWGAQLEAVTYQTTPSTYYPTTTAAYYGPRLVYDPVTLASLGILVEEARTNIAPYSQTFDVAQWGRNEGALTNNATTAPDGISTASSFIPTAGAVTLANTSLLPTFTDSTVYTASCFLKKNGYDWAKIIIRSKDSAVESGAWFNINTGAVGTVDAGCTAAIQSVGNGWHRCSVSKSAGTGATSPRFRIASTNADNVLAFTANGTSGLYLWQAQLEAGTGASSPIPTTSASVTRAADVVNLTGISLTGALTLVSEANAGVVSGTFRVATCSDGTTNNRFGNFLAVATALRCVATVAASGVVVESGARTVGVAFKQASRFDGASTFATSGNGAAVVSGTNAINPASITQLNIGGIPGIPESVGTTISRIRFYRSALNDAQLQSLSA